VLLSGVDNDLFWSGFYDDPFRLLGIRQIFLTPGSEKAIAPHPEWGGIKKYVLSLDGAIQALSDGAVVFAVQQEGVEDISNGYRAIAAAEYAAAHKDFVDVGKPAYEQRLGPGWYRIENGYRWMGKSATVQLAGPQSPAQRLQITGYCPETLLAKGPLDLTVKVNGERAGSQTLQAPGGRFAVDLPVPAAVVGQTSITVTVEVNRTTTIPSDTRVLGLIFGTFRMK
jgi:hypothetical protein